MNDISRLQELDPLGRQCEVARRLVRARAREIHDRIVRWQPEPYPTDWCPPRGMRRVVGVKGVQR